MNIHIRMQGRLGNQMFMYAFARRLIEECPQGTRVKLHIKNESPSWGVTECRLQNYTLNPNIAISLEDVRWFPDSVFSRISYQGIRWASVKAASSKKQYQIENNTKDILKRVGIFLCSDGYRDFSWIASSKKDVFCRGFFQSDQYFPKRSILLHDLSPKVEIRSEWKSFVQKIINTPNAVCMSVRLGDYLRLNNFNVCTADYYQNAIKYIASRIENPTFFLFSDDVPLALKMFDFQGKVIPEPAGGEDYETLYVMSKCQHFIIANSTFSWWAQYLAERNNKIVVAPNRWSNDPGQVCDIYQENWHLLDV